MLSSHKCVCIQQVHIIFRYFFFVALRFVAVVCSIRIQTHVIYSFFSSIFLGVAKMLCLRRNFVSDIHGSLCRIAIRLTQAYENTRARQLYSPLDMRNLADGSNL